MPFIFETKLMKKKRGRAARLMCVVISLFVGHSALATEADPAAGELVKSLSLPESAVPVRQHPRWAAPLKVVIFYRAGVAGSPDEIRQSFADVAGNAEVHVIDSVDRNRELLAGADVFIGFCSPEVLSRLPNLRWMHTYSVGVDRCTGDPDVRSREFILSNNQRVSGPSIAELAIALTLMLGRDLPYYREQQSQRRWARDERLASDLAGKTMLVLGLGGIGTETARRAAALGMRIIATRNSSREGPAYVDRVGLPDEMYALAAEADFVVNALPLTDDTLGLIDRRFFDALKPGAYYVSVGRGQTTVTDDLIDALNDGRLAGAGLDVVDPEPLPSDHPLWQVRNVVITPHVAGRNNDSVKRTLVIARENLRRYVRGDKLLNVVDMRRGY